MAVRIDRVYTRTGDDGETGLAGGGRISKDHVRIEAFGSVDEFNAAVGMIAEELRVLPETSPMRRELEAPLERIQQQLFDAGAFLATPTQNYKKGMPVVGLEEIRTLELEMDRWQETLDPLRSFVLPGGGRVGALLHAARTICRRAEREILRLHRVEPLCEPVLPYVNRLSDWLFVAARTAARLQGCPETLWTPSRRPPPP